MDIEVVDDEAGSMQAQRFRARCSACSSSLAPNMSQEGVIPLGCKQCVAAWRDGFSYLKWDTMCERIKKDEAFQERFKVATAAHVSGPPAADVPSAEATEDAAMMIRSYRKFKRFTKASFREAYGVGPEELGIKPLSIRNEHGQLCQSILVPIDDTPEVEISHMSATAWKRWRLKPTEVFHDDQGQNTYEYVRDEGMKAVKSFLNGALTVSEFNAKLEAAREKQEAPHAAMGPGAASGDAGAQGAASEVLVGALQRASPMKRFGSGLLGGGPSAGSASVSTSIPKRAPTVWAELQAGKRPGNGGSSSDVGEDDAETVLGFHRLKTPLCSILGGAKLQSSVNAADMAARQMREAGHPDAALLELHVALATVCRRLADGAILSLPRLQLDEDLQRLKNAHVPGRGGGDMGVDNCPSESNVAPWVFWQIVTGGAKRAPPPICLALCCQKVSAEWGCKI